MINTLIIEDEEPAAMRLKKLLAEVDPEVEVLAVLDSVESAVKWLEIHDQPDLLLLDIQLADGLSFDIFKQVTLDSYVIFATAYDEYAIRAFELNSIDYLLKPIEKEKLSGSLQKFRRLSSSAPRFDINELMAAIENRKSSYKKRFLVNIGSRIKSVETGSVAFFYSMEKSTFICTRDGHHYPVEFSLENLQSLLDPDVFFRINRQYVINYECIEKIHVLSQSRIKVELVPAADDDLLVSTAKTHRFRLWLDR